MRALNLFCIILVILSIVTLFTINDKVRSLNIKLGEMIVELEKKNRSIKVLNADWAMLNEPRRLKYLGDIYLELHHSTSENYINLDDIPLRVEYLKRSSMIIDKKEDEK